MSGFGISGAQVQVCKQYQRSVEVELSAVSVYVLMCSRVMEERRDGHLPRGIGIESMYRIRIPYLPERAVARARQALARALTFTHPDVNLLLAAPALPLPGRVRASSSVYVYYTVSGLRERAVFLRAATRRARSPRGASTLRCSRRRPCARDGVDPVQYA